MAARLDWGSSLVRVSAWAIFLAAFCLPATGCTLPERTTGPQAVAAAGQLKQAKTFWREIPEAPTVTANAAIAAARGAWFDANWGAPWPLDNVPKSVEHADGHVVIGSGMPGCPFAQSKIPLYPNEIVVEATFKKWSVFLSPSHRSIYTQIEYEVDHVLVPPLPTVWRSPGQLVNVLYPGGTVRLSDGRVINSWIPSSPQQQSRFPMPGGEYVLFLQYVSALGSGYWEGASIEVTDKKVVGGFHGWYPGRIPRGMPLQDFFDLIIKSIANSPRPPTYPERP